MSIHSQGARPAGTVGRLIGRAMNLYHTSLYRQYLSQSLPPDYSTILDIGCGGGRFLKFLADTNATYTLHGIDHSPEMVSLALRVNRGITRAGRPRNIRLHTHLHRSRLQARLDSRRSRSCL